MEVLFSTPTPTYSTSLQIPRPPSSERIMALSVTAGSQSLSFSKALASSTPLFLQTKFSNLSLHHQKSTIIRMGGGPRTYPGGVSKWQWKRMQAKKAKQLLKARLCRERQIYEMRKRAELKAAVSELERPWEVVDKAPTLFSVSADEQVKVLADRFQKPGGFDLWTEKDGPRLFETVDGLPSARFFPKGVVHSVKPYGIIGAERDESESEGIRQINEYKSEFKSDGDSASNRNRIAEKTKRFTQKGNSRRRIRNSQSGPVYDMRLQKDGKYSKE